MAMHTVLGAVAGTSAAAAVSMFAEAGSADSVIPQISGLVSAIAAVIGAAVAVVSFMRHRTDGAALARHEEHDDERFDRIESLIQRQR